MQSFQSELILDDPERGVVLPQIQYHTYAQITQETVFKGRTLPVPSVITSYLKGTELKIFMLILKDIREHAICLKSQAEMGNALGLTNIAISHSMRALANMGIILTQPESAAKRNTLKKSINWDMLSDLEMFFKDTKDEAAVRLREEMGDKNINDLTDDQKAWFWQNFKIFKDEENNEEYK